MGDLTLAHLPEFLDRYGVRYETHGDWLNVGRRSGGFDAMMGVIVHHSASSKSAALATTLQHALTSVDAPVGNMIVSRDKDGPKVVLYAGKASNTAGLGGPVLSSRGVIPRDSANRVTVNIEAENNGVGEPWSDSMCDLYVATVAACIEWGNAHTPGVPLTAGDVWAHREWAPGRKPDPQGPSRFNGGLNGPWIMDRFRGEVFALLLAGGTPEPPYAIGTPIPDIAYGQYGGEVGNLIDVIRFWGWWPPEYAGMPNNWTYDDVCWQGVVNMQLALGVPAQGYVYDRQTARAYSDFVNLMDDLRCGFPPPMATGDTGPDVELLQAFLASNGWYPYAIDGSYGPRTTQGVQQFQKYAKGVGAYTGSIHGQFDDPTRDAACRLA